MLIIGGNRRIVGDLAGAIARLESLLADLERFGSGHFPDDAELEKAPKLDPFALAERTTRCLVGGNVGHPILKGQFISTSELWVLAPELGWARTYSRLYRLGDYAPVGRPE